MGGVYKKLAVRIILAAWIVIWVIFLIRPYLKKDLLNEYASLLKLSTEEKRTYVTGKDLYAFMKFCKDSVKEPATYSMVGVEKDSLEHRRLRYYLYPFMDQDNPEYLFVYKTKGFSRHGYGIFSRLDNETYILKEVR